MTDPSSSGPSNRSPRRFATVLFTDIVGSTGLQAELGDAEWQVLLGHHNRLVRASIDRHGGREISTAGDSFLAVFETPEEAIACALEAGEAVREKGIEIRSGIHTGEIVETEGDVGGIAVNIGARVSSIAGPGEVLVSRTVRDLVRGSDIRLQPRGTHQLKGVSGQWQLYAVAGTEHRGGILRESRVWFDRHRTRATVAIVVVAVVLGLGGLYVVIQERGRSFSPSPAIAGAAPGIAVLPFSVRGDELGSLREGMVDLLSTGLNGVGGLRTISAGTLFTRWREQVAGEEPPDLAIAMEVARRAGARYALVGSVIEVGADVRLVADVYDVSSGDRLGQGEVEGSLEAVLPLVDRLAVEVLQVILQRGEEDLPEISLVSLTTASPDALQNYLEGEVHFRRDEFIPARDAYRRAVEADSTFALAHYRLGYLHYWAPEIEDNDLAWHHSSLAAQSADRLPEREAVLVRAFHALLGRTVDEIEPLRVAVRENPDDAELWYMLGETYLHVYGALGTMEETAEAFERAAELDPGSTHHLAHYVQFAWWLHADSARAAERVETYRRNFPDDSLNLDSWKLGLDLAFGHSAAHRRAIARLHQADLDGVERLGYLLYHPRYAAYAAVLQEIYERAEGSEKGYVTLSLAFERAAWRGRLREGLVYLDAPETSPFWRAWAYYDAFILGLPIPEETLERVFDPGAIDSLAPWPVLFTAGAFAVDRGRWSDYESAMAELERREERAWAAADSFAGVRWTGRRGILEGYGLWRRGQPEAALSLLEDPKTQHYTTVRLWSGRLYQELGRFREAERVYRSYCWYDCALSIEPLVQRELGKVYEALGEYDKARESYEYFVTYWNDADPELQPMVEEARQAIIRLEGLQP